MTNCQPARLPDPVRIRERQCGSHVRAASRETRYMATMVWGTVQTGQGLLADRMRPHADAYTRITGTALYPGSLNVLLDTPWTLPAHPLRLEPAELGVGVNLVPCRVCDQPAFVFRTDFHEAWVEQHRLIELLAAVRLRDTLSVADGDRVAIEFAD
jgi:CTP-dependent riboflavin kinase